MWGIRAGELATECYETSICLLLLVVWTATCIAFVPHDLIFQFAKAEVGVPFTTELQHGQTDDDILTEALRPESKQMGLVSIPVSSTQRRHGIMLLLLCLL